MSFPGSNAGTFFPCAERSKELSRDGVRVVIRVGNRDYNEMIAVGREGMKGGFQKILDRKATPDDVTELLAQFDEYVAKNEAGKGAG